MHQLVKPFSLVLLCGFTQLAHSAPFSVSVTAIGNPVMPVYARAAGSLQFDIFRIGPVYPAGDPFPQLTLRLPVLYWVTGSGLGSSSGSFDTYALFHVTNSDRQDSVWRFDFPDLLNGGSTYNFDLHTFERPDPLLMSVTLELHVGAIGGYGHSGPGYATTMLSLNLSDIRAYDRSNTDVTGRVALQLPEPGSWVLTASILLALVWHRQHRRI